MKKFGKIVAVAGLFLGGMLFSTQAFAQSDAANSNDSKKVVTSAPSKTCQSASASKACCASKGGAHANSEGAVKETAANGGNAQKGSCTKSASACTKSSSSCGSKAMGGSVSETSANAGETSKACKGSKKSCCASKNAESK
jgi:hypothetical protein